MSNTLTRTQAKKWTLGAQVASGVFVLLAVMLGLGALSMPKPTHGDGINGAGNGHTPLPGLDYTQNTANSDGLAQSISSQTIDTIGLAQRFALLENAPIIPDNTVVEPDPISAENTGSNDSGEIAKRVRYIGFINDPNALHAFIRIDGKQRIVAMGQMAKAGSDDFEDLTVEKITAEYIVMSDGQDRAQIKMASRTGQSVTLIEGGSVDVATERNNNGSMLSAEDEATIAALPSRQQPRARIRLERERRGLPPDKVRNRKTPKPLGTARAGFSKNSQNRND
ncbi:MAG: hypothetical protein JKX70_05535 [Phycisphaerales bacterium]|nr:hypothetical protein [Phycisphaerales bacterium]